ncbi:hypothetical protein OR1_01770 [Geobacter sp. OR-1]|uniref:hypothetical protein n=1 Tax=Geobacter sp. OR-1 TaxID=1266765 RepID=UPI000541BAF8|nr:hypothetical protein [Geobacter sp. OR-1]GAM09491.1 hypothetical protein OR1_01770 [Geobacter sp. OR-1]
MNHHKVISDVISKYSDFPGVQADMRRLLKYTESQFRMFLTPLIKEESTPAPTPRSIGQIVATYPDPIKTDLIEAARQITEFAAEVTTATVAALPSTDGDLTREELVTLLANRHHDTIRAKYPESAPDHLHDDLTELATIIVGKMEEAFHESVDKLLELAKSGKELR